MIGTTLLHYRINRKLGEGGMGVVYLATATRLDREVAIKFLPPHVADDPEQRQRFVIEARAAAALNHPNIATIHAIEDVDGKSFIVMEYIEGRELMSGEAADRHREARADIAGQIAAGLQAAHERGIVHRDIKPANIMVTGTGVVKLMDFGLAKIRGGARLTQVGSTMGTAAYMAPEQARGEAVDNRCDIWSFGVVLYELLTGRLPFPGDFPQAILFAILNEDPAPLPEPSGPVEERLQAVVRRCLKKDPEDRYPDAAALAADLSEIGDGSASPAVAATTGAPPAERIGSRRRLPQILGGAAIVLAVALALTLLRPGGPDDGAPLSIVVADFHNLSGEAELDALSGMLITALDQSRRLSVLSRTRMHDVLVQLNRADAERVDEALGREICRQAGVQALVVPTIRRFGALYSVDLKVVDAASGDYLFTHKADAQGLEAIPGLIDRISEATRKGLRESEVQLAQANASVARVTTPNLEAYEAFFKAEAAINRLQFDTALVHLERAIALDATFGLAYYRIAYVRGWNFEALARDYLDLALRYIDRIPERERFLVRAEQARYEQGIAAALAILHDMERLYPDDKEMLLAIGDWSFHSDDFATAIAYFDRVLEMDPDNRRVLYHYPTAVLQAYTHPSQISGDPDTDLAAVRNATRTPLNAVSLIGAEVTLLLRAGHPAEAAARLEKALATERPPRSAAALEHYRVVTQSYLGKFQSALRRLDSLPPLSVGGVQTVPTVLEQAFLAWAAYGEPDSVRTYLDRYYRHSEEPPFMWRNEALAELHALAGDTRRARELLAGEPNLDRRAVTRFVLDAITGSCPPDTPILAMMSSAASPVPPFIRSKNLYYFAACRYARGDVDLAGTILDTILAIPIDVDHYMFITVPPRSLLLRGKVYEAQGNPAAARDMYARLLTLWAGADPDLPDLLEVRQRMADLQNRH